MDKRKLSVEVNELPARVEKLSPSQIKNVFGGCKQKGEICGGKDGDCCDFLSCELAGSSADGTTVLYKCKGY